jgi:hypothetical protein
MTFDYLSTLFVRICGTINPGHTYDEYLVLLAKSGMTYTQYTCYMCLTNLAFCM